MTLERWHGIYFYTEIGRSIRKKLLTLAIFVAMYTNGDSSKMAKVLVFLPRFHACYSRSIKDIFISLPALYSNIITTVI